MEINSQSTKKDSINETLKIPIYTAGHYDLSLFPLAGSRLRNWWEQDAKTKNHARFCLPMIAANSYGFYILSPADVTVTWNGGQTDTILAVTNSCSHTSITNHSASGSFTIQAQILPRTPVNVMTYIKPLPNLLMPYQPLEGLMETWWLVNNFGIVCMVTQPGTFTIRRGDPIAHMIFLGSPIHNYEIYHAGDIGLIEGHRELAQRRLNYTKRELDYLKGIKPNGQPEDVHYTKFKNVCPYPHKIDL